MNTELTKFQNTKNGNNEFAMTVANADKKDSIGTNSRQISRNGLAKLHQVSDSSDLRDTTVAKGLQLAQTGLQASFDSGTKALSAGSKCMIDAIKQSGNKKGLKSIILGAVASVFGVKTLQGLLGAPKRLSEKNQENKAPALLAAGKWIAGGSLALGAIKAFTSGVGLTNPALVIGLIAFTVLSLLVSTYENENSPISKVLNILGLRDKVKSLTDDIQTDKLISN
jgi:hypothetical protein